MSLADRVPGEPSDVDRILADHAVIRPLLARAYMHAGDDTSDQAQRLLALVEPHAAFEDAVFARLLPDHWVRHVLDEHAPIRDGLRAGATGDSRALRDAADLALGHFHEEEQHVIPRVRT